MANKRIMQLLKFILTFSLILNLGTQASISCDMEGCKISKKGASCCKKETTQQSECCCAKMQCKTTRKYNDVLPPIVQISISFQYEYLLIQDVTRECTSINYYSRNLRNQTIPDLAYREYQVLFLLTYVSSVLYKLTPIYNELLNYQD